MKKVLVVLAIALAGSVAQAATTTVIPGVKAVNWDKKGALVERGASAVFYDEANGLLWSNTSLAGTSTLDFDQASSLLAGFNTSKSIEGITNWTLPTVAQFKLLYATQGPDTVTNKGMEKRVFDYLGTYVWTGTSAVANVPSHAAFAANSFLGESSQFTTFANSKTMAVWAVAAVPEPEAYAMLLSGLACIGLIARRGKTTGV